MDFDTFLSNMESLVAKQEVGILGTGQDVK